MNKKFHKGCEVKTLQGIGRVYHYPKSGDKCEIAVYGCSDLVEMNKADLLEVTKTKKEIEEESSENNIRIFRAIYNA